MTLNFQFYSFKAPDQPAKPPVNSQVSTYVHTSWHFFIHAKWTSKCTGYIFASQQHSLLLSEWCQSSLRAAIIVFNLWSGDWTQLFPSLLVHHRISYRNRMIPYPSLPRIILVYARYPKVIINSGCKTLIIRSCICTVTRCFMVRHSVFTKAQ